MNLSAYNVKCDFKMIHSVILDVKKFVFIALISCDFNPKENLLEGGFICI